MQKAGDKTRTYRKLENKIVTCEKLEHVGNLNIKGAEREIKNSAKIYS